MNNQSKTPTSLNFLALIPCAAGFIVAAIYTSDLLNQCEIFLGSINKWLTISCPMVALLPGLISGVLLVTADKIENMAIKRFFQATSCMFLGAMFYYVLGWVGFLYPFQA